MLNKRVLTGLIVIPVLYVVVWKLPPGYFVLLVVLAAAMAQYEFYRMAQDRIALPLKVTGIMLGSLLVFLMALPGQQGLLFVTVALLLLLLVRLFSSRPVEGALEEAALAFLGVFFVALLFGFQGMIRVGMDGKRWLVFLYLVIWASDTAAYYIGTAWGKHRLYEKVSPKKSVEGLLAGITGAVAAALICRIWFFPSLGLAEAAALGFMLAVVGALGDLVESIFKRSVGVKDSGGIVPGHGGMLDRMDSLMFAAPVLYYYITR